MSATQDRCTCIRVLHGGECPEVRRQRDAFLEGERKAWRVLDLRVSQNRRDLAGALYTGVRIYEEHHFRKGGEAARALAGSGGKGKALYAPVEAGKDAYARAVAPSRAAYLEAFSHASRTYHESVAPLRTAFEAARVRKEFDAPREGSAESIPWLPRPPGKAVRAPAPSLSWLLPATAAALFVASASLAIQGLSDPGFLLIAFMVVSVALLGLCAWKGTALFWKLSVMALAAGALTYVGSTGQWAPALAPLTMAAVVLGVFSGLARKTFLRNTAAEGGTP